MVTPVTDLRDIEAGLITAIEAITPTLHTQSKWRYIETEHGSVEFRRFTLDFTPPALEEVDGESIFCNGNSYTTTMRINTVYHDVRDADIVAFIHADQIDLRDALDLSHDPTISGLFYTMPGAFVPETDEEGSVSGYFPVSLRFLAPDGA